MDDIEKLPLTSLHRVILDLHPLEEPNNKHKPITELTQKGLKLYHSKISNR